MPAETRLPVAMPPYAWITILVGSCTVLSLGLACAVPFAALAAVGALTLTRRDALLLVSAAWLANQALGFGLLHYPWTADTLAWGLALLAVTLLATLGAEFCARSLASRPRIMVAALAFLAGFAVYEGLLALVSVATGSSTEALAPGVVAQIFTLNASAFVVFLAASRLRLPGRRRMPRAARSAA